MKIKVHCIAIIDSCTVPAPVLVAEIRVPRDTVKVRRYVLLSEDTRSQISRMTNYAGDYDRRLAPIAQPFALPALIRTHAFNAAGELTEGGDLSSRKGTWGNAESLWVSTHAAAVLLGEFYAWRDKHPPTTPDMIWAPSWGALVGLQMLAIAAGLDVPQANDQPEPEVTQP
jgi:hypothetical protein